MSKNTLTAEEKAKLRAEIKETARENRERAEKANLEFEEIVKRIEEKYKR